VLSWQRAPSMGEFYNVAVRGRYDCRLLRVPEYGNSSTERPRRSSRSSLCESGHWIDNVSDDGTIVKLEDGSVWEVDEVDAIDSALWLPTTDVVACPNKLINTEDSETVAARRIR